MSSSCSSAHAQTHCVKAKQGLEYQPTHKPNQTRCHPPAHASTLLQGLEDVWVLGAQRLSLPTLLSISHVAQQLLLDRFLENKDQRAPFQVMTEPSSPPGVMGRKQVFQDLNAPRAGNGNTRVQYLT